MVEIPLLLKLGLTALSRVSSGITVEQKSVLAATFLSSLDAFSTTTPSSDSVPSVINLSIRHLSKLCGLLQVLFDCKPPQSDALSATLAAISTTCISFLDFADVSVSSVAWNALGLITKIDFDIVLGKMDHLYPRIHHATLEFLQILVSTNFKIRNGVEFMKQWTESSRTPAAADNPPGNPDLMNMYIISKC